MALFDSFIASIYKERHWFKGFLIALLVLLVVYILYCVSNHFEWWDARIKDTYDPIIEPIVNISTLIASIGGYLLITAYEWNERLPKKLTVHFVLPPGSNKNKLEIIFTCLEAYLSGESDIRPWGQQIGRQKFSEDLDFYPYITQLKPRLSSSNSSKDYNLYEAFIFLREVPSSVSEQVYYVWDDNEDDSAENSEYRFKECPTYKKEEFEKMTERIFKETDYDPPSSRKDFERMLSTNSKKQVKNNK